MRSLDRGELFAVDVTDELDLVFSARRVAGPCSSWLPTRAEVYSAAPLVRQAIHRLAEREGVDPHAVIVGCSGGTVDLGALP